MKRLDRRRLRIGLVGGGRRGRQHLATIAALPDFFVLAGVCDVSAGVAASAAAAVGTRPYTSLAAMIDAERLDAIVVATPPEVHHLTAEVAAARGVHMLMETPLGVTRAMMDRTIDAVEKAGVIVEVGENMWRRPTEILNRFAIGGGLIGKVLRVSSFYEDAGHDSCYHTMSRLCFFARGEVAEVVATNHRFDLDPIVTTPANGREIAGPFRMETLTEETWTQAVLYFDNGVVGSCTFITGWNRPLRWAHPHFTSAEGTEGFCAMSGPNQHILRLVRHGMPYTYQRKVDFRERARGRAIRRYYYDTDPQVSYEPPFDDRPLPDVDGRGVEDGLARASELLSLHTAVVLGEPPQYTLAEARRDQELSIMIHESARLGRPVRKLEGETAWERAQHERARKLFGVT